MLKVWPDRKTSCQKYDSAGHLGYPELICTQALSILRFRYPRRRDSEGHYGVRGKGELAMKLTFTKVRETKGAVRYERTGDDGGSETIYLRKATLEKQNNGNVPEIIVLATDQDN